MSLSQIQHLDTSILTSYCNTRVGCQRARIWGWVLSLKLYQAIRADLPCLLFICFSPSAWLLLNSVYRKLGVWHQVFLHDLKRRTVKMQPTAIGQFQQLLITIVFFWCVFIGCRMLRMKCIKNKNHWYKLNSKPEDCSILYQCSLLLKYRTVSQSLLHCCCSVQQSWGTSITGRIQSDINYDMNWAAAQPGGQSLVVRVLGP